ncbi:MAG: LysR family transcriptional regulator [bacterium]|nr:LysR family transcriptional regulator [bacterium]MCM1376327.1 LysR family transcriptional regulator [Muribaculum sp.]
MDINFEYYKIFYFVAKYGNITKAATAIGSNQPNVTRIMKMLESQLNCRLFVREARGISLTKEGEILYSHVEVAYRHLLNAQEEIYKRDSQRNGTVEIGATETALHLFLLKALRDFKEEYPRIRIRIHNHTTPEIMKHLISGKLELAVITTPFDVPRTCSSVKVLDFEEILVGGTQYSSLGKTIMRLDDIKKYSWIGLGRESVTYHLYKNFFIEQGIDLEPDMEVATSDLMLPMIENNLGIGFVPEQLARPLLEEKKLVQIRLNCDIPRRSIQIVSDKGRGKSLAAETFYQFLKK